MGPGGKIILSFVGGVAFAMVAFHGIWQLHSKAVVDLSGWIAAYEAVFPPDGSHRPAVEQDALAQRVAQLETRIASLETALETASPPQQQVSTEEPSAVTVIALPALPPETAETAETEESAEDVDIEVLSWEWVRRSTTKVRGQVRNASDADLENIRALVEWYDDQGRFLKSTEVPFSISPLPPGETTPFQTVVRNDARMHSARLRFTTSSGALMRSVEAIRTETIVPD